MDTGSPARAGGEGLGLLAVIAAIGAALTVFRYAPWLLAALLAAALLTALIVALIPRGMAGRAALCAILTAAITAPPAVAAIVNDYQHTATRLQAAPAAPGGHARARGRRPSTRDMSRKASRRQARPLRRVTVRSGFLPDWNPTRGVLGPFHPSALTRWWALTASVTTALAALLTAALLAAFAAYGRRRPSAGRHASWPQIGHSSRTWRPS